MKKHCCCVGAAVGACLIAGPLDDIGNLKSVVLTVKRGVPYRRSAYRPIQKDEVKGDEQRAPYP